MRKETLYCDECHEAVRQLLSIKLEIEDSPQLAVEVCGVGCADRWFHKQVILEPMPDGRLANG